MALYDYKVLCVFLDQEISFENFMENVRVSYSEYYRTHCLSIIFSFLSFVRMVVIWFFIFSIYVLF